MCTIKLYHFSSCGHRKPVDAKCDHFRRHRDRREWITEPYAVNTRCEECITADMDTTTEQENEESTALEESERVRLGERFDFEEFTPRLQAIEAKYATAIRTLRQEMNAMHAGAYYAERLGQPRHSAYSPHAV